LVLPEGLKRVGGEETQPVPLSTDGKKDASAEVAWRVQVEKAGKFAVRVSSSTGVARTSLLTITQPDAGAGRFKLALEGDFAPGKVFSVLARVDNPVPKQTLALVLPADLRCVEGDLTTTVPEPGIRDGASVMTWKVKVERPGRHTVRVVSSTGVGQGKVITIQETDQNAGRFTLELQRVSDTGKDFSVTARVMNPLAGQKLTLHMPPQMKLIEGERVQSPPTFAAGVQGTSVVTWRVRVGDVGREAVRLPIRVESTTGLGLTRTLVLTPVENKQSGTLFGK
jgi:hypothetical protein